MSAQVAKNAWGTIVHHQSEDTLELERLLARLRCAVRLHRVAWPDALGGMIMRDTVVLVEQIDEDQRAGLAQWEAIVESTIRRSRPVLLTALAAIPAMIPLSRSVFWAPMAITLVGGLLAGTILTLLFLPALWFGVQKPDGTTVPPAGGEHAEAVVEIKALQPVSLAVPG